MVLSTERLKPLDDVIGSLSPTEQGSLRSGKAIVNVVSDRYVSYMLVRADIDPIWSVLTDYDHFADFLPSVQSSEVLEAEGDRAVVEQIAKLKVMLAEMESRVRTENIRTPKKRIDFRLIEGDLEIMEGDWQLIPVQVSEGKDQSQPLTLVKQSVHAKIGNPLLEGAFEAVYTKNIKRNLKAIAQEVYKRQDAETE